MAHRHVPGDHQVLPVSPATRPALAAALAPFVLLTLFTQARQGFFDVANSEVVGVEIVRTLTGSIGLVASVPITTALAALVATRRPGPGGVRRARPRREERFWRDSEG